MIFLQKIPIPENGKDGLPGKDGICGDPGKDGAKGDKGKDGKDAPDLKTILDKVKPLLPKAASNGRDGSDGEDGSSPDHELDKKRLRIRFKNPDGTWGDWLELGKELGKLIARQVGFVNRGGSAPEMGIWKKCIEKLVCVPSGSQILRGGELCILGVGELKLDGDAEAFIV